jgi:hypothetical protein
MPLWTIHLEFVIVKKIIYLQQSLPKSFLEWNANIGLLRMDVLNALSLSF